MASEDDAGGTEQEHEWPAWRLPVPELAAEDGYGSLGRYVFSGNLEDHPAAFRSDTREQLAKEHTAADLDRSIALSLFEDLRRARLRYAPVHWERQDVQGIRSPHDVLAFTRYGTCIDLAVLLATACTVFDLDTFIVVLREARGGHALVAVRLGGPRRASSDGVRWDSLEVGYVDDLAELSADDGWLLLDPTHACVGLGAAGPAPRAERLDPDWAHLVRVPSSERQYVPESRVNVLTKALPEPEPLARVVDLPRADGTKVHEGEPSYRDQVIDELSHATGVVVLHGGQGVGKSRLALDLARAWGEGFGWRLLGTDLRARDLSLGRNEAFEQGVAETLDPNDVAPFAAAALARLDSASGRWVVVLDNLVLPADGSLPRWVTELVPQEGRNQLLVVTTNDGPEHFPHGWQLVPVRSAPGSDLDPDIAGVSAGSVLLQSAFRRLVDHRPDVLDPAWATTESPDVQTGAATLWSAAERAMSDDEAAEARRLSLMPPDDVGEVLAGTADAMWDHGLVGRDGDLTSMHRLVGGAIRASLGQGVTTVVESVLHDAARAAKLLVSGDRATTDQLSEALKESCDGLSLAALANIQEVHDNAEFRSTFDRAGKLLDPKDPAHAIAYADFLHDQARRIVQNGGTPEERERAIANALEAERLRTVANAPGLLKHRAVRALLLRQTASNLPKDSPDRRRGLEEARDVLQAGYEARRDDPQESSISVDRALYNLAGTHIDLAQTVGIDPVAGFEAALDVYQRTRAFRYETYGEMSAFTGASVWGEGMAHYYLALHTSGPERLAHADVAVELINRSVRIRSKFNKGEHQKSAELLIKAAVLQHAVAWDVDHVSPVTPLLKKVNEAVAMALGELVDVWSPPLG